MADADNQVNLDVSTAVWVAWIAALSSSGTFCVSFQAR